MENVSKVGKAATLAAADAFKEHPLCPALAETGAIEHKSLRDSLLLPRQTVKASVLLTSFGMYESSNSALVPRAPSSLEKAEPGAKRILSGMVADTLALAKKEPPRESGPLRIVVVDDEPYCLEAFELIIRYWFKDVTLLLFSNSSEAWQELAREGPDLLILDMPLSGLEILPLLAEHKVKYPIVATSAFYSEKEMRQHADPKLNVSFLWKPFDAETLVKALERGLKTPCDLATPDETKPIKNQTKTPKPRGKLLIVDKEDSARQCMRQLFKDEYD